MRVTTLAFSAALIGLGLSLAGCSEGGQTDTRAEPPIAHPASPPPDGTTPALPLDGYQVMSGENQAIFLQAHGLLIQRCMKEKGYGYTPGQPPSAPAYAMTVDSDHLGLLSTKAASTTAYHVGRTDTTGQKPSAAAQPPETRTPQYQAALNGSDPSSSDRGCLGEADRRLTPSGQNSGEAPRDVIGELRVRATERTSKDSRVTKAMADWSRCMKEKGYTYSNPVAASSAAWPDPVGAKEIATATTDMACKNQVNLIGLWYAVEAAYQDRFIEDNAADLTAFKDVADRRMALAKKVLGR